MSSGGRTLQLCHQRALTCSHSFGHVDSAVRVQLQSPVPHWTGPAWATCTGVAGAGKAGLRSKRLLGRGGVLLQGRLRPGRPVGFPPPSCHCGHSGRPQILAEVGGALPRDVGPGAWVPGRQVQAQACSPGWPAPAGSLQGWGEEQGVGQACVLSFVSPETQSVQC